MHDPCAQLHDSISHHTSKTSHLPAKCQALLNIHQKAFSLQGVACSQLPYAPWGWGQDVPPENKLAWHGFTPGVPPDFHNLLADAQTIG
jgi:hypothetical protein